MRWFPIWHHGQQGADLNFFMVNDQSNVAPEPKSLVVYNYRDTEERYIPRTAQEPPFPPSHDYSTSGRDVQYIVILIIPW